MALLTLFSHPLDFLCGKFIFFKTKSSHLPSLNIVTVLYYAAVNGHLELTLLKGRQRFDAILTSNLEVYKFRDW